MLYTIRIEHVRPTENFIKLLNKEIKDHTYICGYVCDNRNNTSYGYTFRFYVLDDLVASIVYKEILKLFNYLVYKYSPKHSEVWSDLYNYFSADSKYLEMSLCRDNLDIIYNKYIMLDGQYRVI